jgi:hypothetical protein
LQDGVGIYSTGNLLERNVIGTDQFGTVPVGNQGNGIAIRAFQYGYDNTIGGSDAGAGNTIANNGQDGVLIDTGTGEAIQGNAIFGNQFLGIELRNNGNLGQAAPVLTSATSDGTSTTVAGTLTGAPDTAFSVEFFANPVCDPSGFGQGEYFLGAALVTTDATGQASFTVTLSVGVDPSQFVTATATDPTGNTSEFSNCVAVSMPTSPGASTASLIALGTGPGGSPAVAASNPGTTSARTSTGEVPATRERLPVDGFLAADHQGTPTARPSLTGGTPTPAPSVVAQHALDAVLEGFADPLTLNLLGGP